MAKVHRDFLVVLADSLVQEALELLASRERTPWVVVQWTPTDELPDEYMVIPRRRAEQAFARMSTASVGESLTGVSGEVRLRVVKERDGSLGVLQRPIYRGVPGPADGLVSVFETALPASFGVEAEAVSPEALSRELAAQLPETLRLGGEGWLLVWLSEASGNPIALPLELPAGARVDVLVKTSGGVSYVGEATGAIEVASPQSDEPLRFKLRGERVGVGTVSIYVHHAGVCVGKLDATTTVVTTPARSDPSRASGTVYLGTPPQPDLTILITERADEVTFFLNSGDGRYYNHSFGATQLNASMQYFRGFFKDIELLRTSTPEEGRRTWSTLKTKGMGLFDTIFPKDLQRLLWDLRGRNGSLQITSDQPWIPWEFCRLMADINGTIEEGDFFSEAFAVSRWISGARQDQKLRLRNMAIVVPSDSNLSRAREEREFLRSLDARPTRAITEIPAEYDAVVAAMTKGHYDAWHFTGHAHADQASDPNRAYIELAGRKPLHAENVAGGVLNVLNPAPFMFLNACQSGQAGLSLTGPGGWATRFIRKGERCASAFLGTYWAVNDVAAAAFARKLYAGLFAGQTIAEATRAARLAIRDLERPEPTWLAYTLYAHPNARLAEG